MFTCVKIVTGQPAGASEQDARKTISGIFGADAGRC
jgi:hypothetical protein